MGTFSSSHQGLKFLQFCYECPLKFRVYVMFDFIDFNY